MSILSQLFNGKIDFSQAVAQGEQWFSTILSKAPAAVQSDVATALSDFKQAASDAVSLADTALGPILLVGTTAVEVAANTALTAAIGGTANALTPAIDAGITSVSNSLKAAIDAEAAQLRAKILGSTVTITTAGTGYTTTPQAPAS